MARNVEVAVIDGFLEGSEHIGLLGLSFLSRFEVQLDDAKGELVLRVRK